MFSCCMVRQTLIFSVSFNVKLAFILDHVKVAAWNCNNETD